MRIHLLSDLHLEFAPLDLHPPDADVVVLAGDVWLGSEGVNWAARAFPNKRVLYVLGNHEFYGGQINKVLMACRQAAIGTTVRVLERDAAVIEGVRFLGMTLWTDFELFGSSMSLVGRALWAAKERITDFSCITFGTTGWMSPAQSVMLHRASHKWLEEQLSEPFQGKTVVITHHAPSARSIAPQYADNILSAAFASDMEGLMPSVDLWLHGHTHHAIDYQVGRCRVLCNPRGYCADADDSRAAERTSWRPDQVIEI